MCAFLTCRSQRYNSVHIHQPKVCTLHLFLFCPNVTCAQCTADIHSSIKHAEDCTQVQNKSESSRKHNENGSFIINIQERKKKTQVIMSHVLVAFICKKTMCKNTQLLTLSEKKINSVHLIRFVHAVVDINSRKIKFLRNFILIFSL